MKIQSTKNYYNSAKPLFCGTNSTDNHQLQLATNYLPAKQPKKPMVNISTKSSGSKKAWIAGGAVAAAIGGTVFYVLSRGNFKAAKTIEEAELFAKNEFNVKEFNVDDLEVANWINEGLFNVKKYSKGKSIMPKEINYVNEIFSDAGDRTGPASYYKGILNISRKDWQECTQLVRKSGYKSYIEFLKRHPLTSSKSRFSKIYHEMGHANHELSANYDKMTNLADAKALGITDVSLTKEFLKDTKTLERIRKFFRDYATLSPQEFVADTFDMIVAGRKVPKDIMQLYKKYEGPLF